MDFGTIKAERDQWKKSCELAYKERDNLRRDLQNIVQGYERGEPMQALHAEINRLRKEREELNLKIRKLLSLEVQLEELREKRVADLKSLQTELDKTREERNRFRSIAWKVKLAVINL